CSRNVRGAPMSSPGEHHSTAASAVSSGLLGATAFLPQRDPDASGRTRPRAPGCALPAAAA
ncbi:DUF6412 domain-containing protein, partial [Streptomyces sp. NPDC005568]|uniref:DUF6412 domain-containing protein n=1 Tax=Streptomyces sp. NPDC005568 TaxID=3156887 RepID=UPI0033ADE019